MDKGEGGEYEVERSLATRDLEEETGYLLQGNPVNEGTWQNEVDLKCEELREKKPQSTLKRKSRVVVKVSQAPVQNALRHSRLSLGENASSSHALVTKAPAASVCQSSCEPAVKKRRTETGTTVAVDVSTSATQGPPPASRFVIPRSMKRVPNPETPGSNSPTTPLNQAPAPSVRQSSREPAVKKKQTKTGTTGAVDVLTPTTQGPSTPRSVYPPPKSTSRARHRSGRFMKLNKGQDPDLLTTSTTSSNPLIQAPATSNRESGGGPAVKKLAKTGTTDAVDVSTPDCKGPSTSRSRKRVTDPEAPGSDLPTTSGCEPALKKLAKTGTTDAVDSSTLVTQGSSTSRIVDPSLHKPTRRRMRHGSGRSMKPNEPDLPTTSTTSLIPLNPKRLQKVMQKSPVVTKLPPVQNTMPSLIPFPTTDVIMNGNNDEDDDIIVDVASVEETYDLHYSSNDLLQKMAQMEHPVLVQSGSGVNVINKKPVDGKDSPVTPLIQKALSRSFIPVVQNASESSESRHKVIQNSPAVNDQLPVPTQRDYRNDSPEKIVHLPWMTNDARPVQKSADPGPFVRTGDDDDVTELERMVRENPSREVDDDGDVVFMGEKNEGPVVVQVAVEPQLVGEDQAVVQEDEDKDVKARILADFFGEPGDPQGDAAIAARDYTDCTITQHLRINGEVFYNVKFADDSRKLVRDNIITKVAGGHWFMYVLRCLEARDRKKEEAKKKRDEERHSYSKKLRRR